MFCIRPVYRVFCTYLSNKCPLCEHQFYALKHTHLVSLCAWKNNHYNVNIVVAGVCTRKHLADLFKLFSVWLLTWSVQSNLHVVTVHTG